MPTLKEQALDLLEILHDRKNEYDRMNSKITRLMGCFPTYIQCCDSSIEAELVELLDVIFGDEIASYYLYESSNMSNGGSITENGICYKIKTFKDVVKFVNRTKE